MTLTVQIGEYFIRTDLYFFLVHRLIQDIGSYQAHERTRNTMSGAVGHGKPDRIRSVSSNQ
jgi:hypothetical protein